eukprot:COSAG05_NODE_505_length_9196_cov_3.893591_9_plen_106_part_00
MAFSIGSKRPLVIVPLMGADRSCCGERRQQRRRGQHVHVVGELRKYTGDIDAGEECSEWIRQVCCRWSEQICAIRTRSQRTHPPLLGGRDEGRLRHDCAVDKTLK